MLPEAKLAVALTVLIHEDGFNLAELVLELPGLARREIESSLNWLTNVGCAEMIGQNTYIRTPDVRSYAWELSRHGLYSRNPARLAIIAQSAQETLSRVAAPHVATKAIARLFAEDLG